MVIYDPLAFVFAHWIARIRTLITGLKQHKIHTENQAEKEEEEERERDSGNPTISRFFIISITFPTFEGKCWFSSIE